MGGGLGPNPCVFLTRVRRENNCMKHRTAADRRRRWLRQPRHRLLDSEFLDFRVVSLSDGLFKASYGFFDA